MIIKPHKTHLQKDKYWGHKNSSISLVHMNETYIENIQKIVLSHSQYMHENLLAHRASIIRWSIQVQNYNGEALDPIVEH